MHAITSDLERFDERPYAPSVGATVDGRYLLRRLVAKGGMGIVFEAEHLFTKRPTALKVLKDEALRTEEHRERLMREAHALTAARHPGFVDVLDAGVCRRHGPYLALEMLEGRTLDGILAARGRLALRDVVAVGLALSDALAAAHAHGVLHRDIKPSNIFIARDEREGEVVKLIDLGIAALQGTATRPSDRRLTQSNAILGTPEYMAPEQLFAREDVNFRADVYALGVTLFECLTGSVPFVGTYPEVLAKVNAAKAAPSVCELRPEVPSAIEACIARALALDPAARYPNVRAFGEALCLAFGDAPLHTHLLPNARATVEDRRDAPTKRERAVALPVVVPPAQSERRFKRAPYVTPVLLFEGGRTPLEARTEDISAGGMLVVGSRPCEQGAQVQVRFALPGNGHIVTARAVVRWVRPGRGRHAMGLEFLDATPDAVDVIEGYVASSSAGERSAP